MSVDHFGILKISLLQQKTSPNSGNRKDRNDHFKFDWILQFMTNLSIILLFIVRGVHIS